MAIFAANVSWWYFTEFVLCSTTPSNFFSHHLALTRRIQRELVREFLPLIEALQWHLKYLAREWEWKKRDRDVENKTKKHNKAETILFFSFWSCILLFFKLAWIFIQDVDYKTKRCDEIWQYNIHFFREKWITRAKKTGQVYSGKATMAMTSKNNPGLTLARWISQWIWGKQSSVGALVYFFF